ncbi:hypothetical protein [Nostoc sp.]|uniref:hypothetical protein n=1 Tax=Nostoc sp. TaxID=1180 RepID=UPI00359477AD
MDDYTHWQVAESPSLRGATAPLRFPDLYPFGEASYAQRLRQGEARGVDLGGSQSICYQEEDLFIHPLSQNAFVDETDRFIHETD